MSRMVSDWIAVDWGTSNLRAYAMGRDGVLARAQSQSGSAGLARSDFEPALLELVADWLPADRPIQVVACGMLGSRQGWVEAPYARLPCRPFEAGRLARAVCRDARLRVSVVPGIRQESPADVMRGEETQLAGFLVGRPGHTGIVCLPGTHTKWVQLDKGVVTGFRTFMTGELFALVAERSILRHGVASHGWDAGAFAAGVSDTLKEPAKLASFLFAIRSEGLLHALTPEKARARLSGLLIGAELAATRDLWGKGDTELIGAEGPVDAYRSALSQLGVTSHVADAEEMTLAGLSLARQFEEA